MNVIKRDGRLIEFNKSKIADAILKAMNHTIKGQDIKIAKDIAQDIADNTKETISVEEIQDIVEKKLMESERKDVAKEYIIYRNKRNIARGRKQYDIYMDIVNTVPNDVTRENANMNADTPAGMMMKFASESSKPFVDDCLLSEQSKYYVANNYIHIHDKDYYPTKSLTCLHHPLDYILHNGFRAGHGSSRPAKRIETASIIGCISMEQVQNEMHGGQSIPAFDFYLAPYVRLTYIEEVKRIEELTAIDLNELYDAKIDDYTEEPLGELKNNDRYMKQAINNTVKRVHQSMEAFIHNMNTIHSRGGNQVVFSSINYGTDTSPEGRCIIREVLKSTYQGVGNGETPIFPIHIWKKKRGINYLPGDKNYDLYKFACKVSAKRFFPNFLNLDATFNCHEAWNANDPRRFEKEVSTMGCRTRVFKDRHGEKTSIGRGNLSFSTINIVKLALECKDLEDEVDKKREFFKKLQKCIDIASEQLYDRYIFQCSAVKKQFPMLMSGLWIRSEKLESNDKVEDVLKHGTLGIGFIGLAETLIVLTGKHHGEDEKSQELGLEIIKFMNKKIKEKSDYYDLNYSLLATPAEGLSGKFIKKDRKQFGSIPHVTDKEYYTNSSHIPVWYNCSIEYKAKIEAPYHELEKGGHIFYVELDGDATHNPAAVMQTVDLMDKYNIGYGSVNHTRNRCKDCGYEDASENLKICPECGSDKIDTIQRITGYLVGGVDSWNNAKRAELKDRVKHSCQ